MTLNEILESRTIADLKPLRAQIPVAGPATRKADLVAAISGYLLSDQLATPVAQLSELDKLTTK